MSSAERHSIAGPRYISIGAASKFLGVSIQSLRAYERSGRIKCWRTLGPRFGHRRYLLSELENAVLGVVPASQVEKQENCGVVCYCRVSSQGQSQALVLKQASPEAFCW
jgi:predicted site-specific integrase-resolvase